MAFDFAKFKSVLGISGRSKTPTQVIGVDVGASSIKVVQLRDEKGVPTLDTYGELQLGPYGGGDIGTIVSLEQKKLTEALVDIMRESSISGNTVAFSIPYTSSFMVRMTLNTIDAEEIASRIPVEARKYIPVSLQEVSLDWIELSQDEEAKTTTLLVVAIYNEALTKMQGVLGGAGLQVVYNELEPFSAIRSVKSKNDVEAYIDFGAETTRLYIVQGGNIVGTHSLLLSGTEITNIYMSAQSLSFKDAEERKRMIDISASDEAGVKEVDVALRRGMKEFSNVLTRTEQELGIAIENVVCVGGGSLLLGLMPLAQEILQKNVVIGESFSKVAYPAFLDKAFKNIGPSFSVAVGLALRVFELDVE